MRLLAQIGVIITTALAGCGVILGMIWLSRYIYLIGDHPRAGEIGAATSATLHVGALMLGGATIPAALCTIVLCVLISERRQ